MWTIAVRGQHFLAAWKISYSQPNAPVTPGPRAITCSTDNEVLMPAPIFGPFPLHTTAPSKEEDNA